jgi:hypothetical protein
MVPFPLPFLPVPSLDNAVLPPSCKLSLMFPPKRHPIGGDRDREGGEGADVINYPTKSPTGLVDGMGFVALLPPPPSSPSPLTPLACPLYCPLHPPGLSVFYHCWFIVIFKGRADQAMILSYHHRWLTCTIIFVSCSFL